MTVEELILRIRVDSSDLKGLDRFQRIMSKSRDIVNQLGRRAALATKQFVEDSIDNYRQFEKTMTSVRRIGQLTEEDFAKLEKMTRQVARGLGSLTASQLAEIEVVAAQLGIQGAENIVNFSTKVGKGVLALDKFKGSAEKLATHMAKQKVIFKGSIQDIDSYMSVLNALSNTTAINELELSNFLIALKGIPQIMKMSQAEATAWGSVMQESGLKASESARGINRAWTELIKTTGEQDFRGFGRAAEFIQNQSKDTETAIRRLEEITGKSRDQFASLKAMMVAAADVSGTETFKVIIQQLSQIKSETELSAKAQEIFGTFGAKAVLPLIQNYQTLQERIKFAEQTASEGAKSINKAYEIAMASGTAQFDMLSSKVNDIQLVIGGSLVPALAEVAKTTLGPLLDDFSDWLQNSKEAQIILTETIPQAIAFLGQAIATTAKIIKTITIGISEAGTWWGETIGQIEEVVERIQIGIRNLDTNIYNFIESLKVGFITIFKEIQTIVDDTFDGIVEDVTNAVDFIAHLPEKTVEAFIAALNNIKEIVQIMIDFIIGKFQQAEQAIIGSFERVNQKVQSILSKLPGLGEVDIGTKTESGSQNIQGMIGAIQRLRTENDTIFDQNTQLDQAYKDLYRNLASETDKSREPTQNLQDEFARLQEMINTVADTAYRHSVLPELRGELDYTSEKVIVLQQQFAAVGTQIDEILPKLQQMTQLQSSVGGSGLSATNQALKTDFERKQQYADILKNYGETHMRSIGWMGYRAANFGRFQEWLVKEKPEFLDLFQRFGTSMPAFQSGGYVPTTGPAILHGGEYVLNRQQVANLQNRQASGGGITINISGKVIDRQAFQQFTREIRQELTRQGTLRVGG